MSWYILKDRRHLGPFDENRLRKYFQRKEISDQEFLISKEKADKGELSYSKLSDLFPTWAKRVGSVAPDTPIEVPKKIERVLGNFTEDEILKSEVSRVFMDSLDTVDLLKGSQELTKTGLVSNAPLSKKPTKLTTLSKHNPIKNSPTSNREDEAVESFQDIQKTKANKLLLPVSLVFMFLVLATFPFLGKVTIPQKASPTLTKNLEKMPIEAAAPSSPNSSFESGRSKLTVKVPELVDPRTRQLEAERERERDRREKEIAEDREHRDKQRAPAEQGERALELNPQHADGENDMGEEPMPDGEGSEFDDLPMKSKKIKAPSELEEFEPPSP